MLTDVVKLELTIWNAYLFWPKTTNIFKLYLYNFGTFIMLILNVCVYITTMGISAMQASHLDELAESLFMLLTLIAMIPKYLTIIGKRKEIQKLIVLLDSDSLIQDGDDDVKKMLNDSIKIGKLNTRFFLSVSLSTVVLIYALPFMDLSHRRLPLPAYYGVDHTLFPW